LYTLVVNADGSNVGTPYLLPVFYIKPDGILHANADGSEVYLPWLLPVPASAPAATHLAPPT
jgi:hypothetical protein